MAVKSEVVMYATRFCPYCVRARALFSAKKVEFHEIDVGQSVERHQEMISKSGRHTVPQIWIGNQHIGGCDELMALDRSNKLDALLAELSIEK